MTGGAGVPDQVAAVAALGDEPFEFIACPGRTWRRLNTWQAVMDDSTGRWSWAKQLFGHVYSAKRGTVGTLVAAGQARNDQHMTIQAAGAGRTATVLGASCCTGGAHGGVHLRRRQPSDPERQPAGSWTRHRPASVSP